MQIQISNSESRKNNIAFGANLRRNEIYKKLKESTPKDIFIPMMAHIERDFPNHEIVIAENPVFSNLYTLTNMYNNKKISCIKKKLLETIKKLASKDPLCDGFFK